MRSIIRMKKVSIQSNFHDEPKGAETTDTSVQTCPALRGDAQINMIKPLFLSDAHPSFADINSASFAGVSAAKRSVEKNSPTFAGVSVARAESCGQWRNIKKIARRCRVSRKVGS